MALKRQQRFLAVLYMTAASLAGRCRICSRDKSTQTHSHTQWQSAHAAVKLWAGVSVCVCARCRAGACALVWVRAAAGGGRIEEAKGFSGSSRLDSLNPNERVGCAVGGSGRVAKYTSAQLRSLSIQHTAPRPSAVAGMQQQQQQDSGQWWLHRIEIESFRQTYRPDRLGWSQTGHRARDSWRPHARGCPLGWAGNDRRLASLPCFIIMPR